MSGLTFGVDAIAHRAALEAGGTIALVIGGLDAVYPEPHAGLARQIQKTRGSSRKQISSWYAIL